MAFRKIMHPLRKTVHGVAKYGGKVTEGLAGGALVMGQPELAIPIAGVGAQVTGAAKVADAIIN